MNAVDMDRVTRDLPTKAAKVRALAKAGVTRAEIARFLGIRYQHVRNVLTSEAPSAKPAGVSDAAQAPYIPRQPTQTVVSSDGSVTLPPEWAALLNAQPGEALVVVAEDGGLWVGTRAAGLQRAQALIRKFVPQGVRLSDDLVAEREREAAADQPA